MASATGDSGSSSPTDNEAVRNNVTSSIDVSNNTSSSGSGSGVEGTSSDSEASMVTQLLQYPCTRRTAVGAGIGAVLGGGFHMVAGPSAIVIGQPGRVRMQYIARQAGLASFRIGGLFAMFTAMQCGAAQHLGWDNGISAFTAGAISSGIVHHFSDGGRLEIIQAMVEDRVKSAVKGPQGSSIGASLFKSRASVLLYSAFSGGMVWGGGYTALKYFGLNW